MKKAKSHRRTFWWTAFIILVVVCIMDFSIWYALERISRVLAPLITSAPGQPEVTTAIQTFHSLEQYFLMIVMPASFVMFLLVVGSIRLVYRTGGKNKGDISETVSEKPSKKESEQEQAQKKAREQRLYLHLISLLQREGRLIDFFAENLDTYDDSQIGAAVREIHATCRRVVEKSLSLKPVIGSLEGESVTIESGFDPVTVKLVGNVSGEPPFSGILRHRGWQAGRIEMPTFSGDQQPGVIAPAEVEIE